MGEFELSNNLIQLVSDSAVISPGLALRSSSVLRGYNSLLQCTRRASQCMSSECKFLGAKNHGSLGVEVAIGAGSPASSNQKGGRGGLVSLTKGVLSEQTKKQVLRFQAAKLQCISLCTHIYISVRYCVHTYTIRCNASIMLE